MYISIPAPTKGATSQTKMLLHGLIISIPAPTKGATQIVNDVTLMPFISIPAPTKGATWRFSPTLPDWIYFNPRTHEGCDFTTFLFSLMGYLFQSPHPRRVRPFKVQFNSTISPISIPAPTKGATLLLPQ